MENLKSVTVEGVNFNATLAASKSKKDFIDENASIKQFKDYPEDKRRKLLGESGDACKKEVEPPVEKKEEVK